MRRLAALPLLALLALGLTGCAGVERDAPAPATPQPSAAPDPSAAPETIETPEPTVSSTAYGLVTLHTTEYRNLLAESRPSDGGRTILVTGALAVNERGCFGVGNGDEESFSLIVFPHGTGIAGGGADAGLEFAGERFALGDVLALGGGGAYLDAQGEWLLEGWIEGSREHEAVEICGSVDEVFVAGGEVQLLADFERENAERFAE